MPGSDERRLRWRWRDLPLRVHGIAMVGTVILPIVLGGAFLYSATRKTERADAAVARTIHIKSQLDRISTLVAEAELGARNYLVTRSPEALAGIRSTSGTLATVITDVSTQLTDQAQRERLRGFIKHAQGRTLNALIEYAQKNPPTAPTPVDLIARSHDAMARLRADIAEMAAVEDASLTAYSAEAHRAHRRQVIVVGLGIGGLVLALALVMLFMGSLASRIAAATANASRLAQGQPLQPMIDGRDEVGALADALTRTSDLLERRDRELQRRLEEIAAANTELEAFSYSVSHDLRAPLRHITGFAALLQKRAADRLDGESARYLETIAASARRMGRLVDDLLAFSRMARAEMLYHDVDLDDIVKEVVTEAGNDTAGRTIRWRTLPLPPVRGDRNMLRAALTNLIANAVKYTSTRPVAEIEIGSKPGTNGDRVLYVRDNGVGFDMAYADKLFGVFQRLHGPDEFEGTGIGLANVRRIVQRHGGKTWAEAAVDRGATFFISLPTAQHAAAAKGQPTA